MKDLFTMAFLLVPGITGALWAEVQTATNGYFTVKTTVTVQATPPEVWESLIDVSSWWSPAHTFSGDSSNLSLDAEPGRGFLEKLPGGGCVRHMDVVYSDPGLTLRMAGALGPLQEYPLQGTMTISIRHDRDATTISVVYHVAGYFPTGLDQVAPAVDQVITEQFRRLGTRISGQEPE